MKEYGIPTRYHDVQFRSRLEARWAAFFDLLGWDWQYEPLDLRGYIPDFVLTPRDARLAPVLVEVKPGMSLQELVGAMGKLYESGWEREYLLVGARLFASETVRSISGGWACGLGLFGDTRERGGALPWVSHDGARQASWEGQLGLLMEHPECWNGGLTGERTTSRYHECRICGLLDGQLCAWGMEYGRRLWAEAGAAVQWRPEIPPGRAAIAYRGQRAALRRQ